MTTDIELFLEGRIGGAWVSLQAWGYEDGPNEIFKAEKIYDVRNSVLFAYLAGVCNRPRYERVIDPKRDIFQTDGGEPIVPIRERRGMPLDLSPQVWQCSRDYEDDMHSASWLTIGELVRFDWRGTSHVTRGLVTERWSHEEALRYGIPPTTFSELVVHHGEFLPVEHQWTETALDCCGEFLATIPSMIRRAIEAGVEDVLEDVRIVFWFDN